VPGRAGERGSALVIALLVAVILMLLGIAFLLMGETENRIAQNEKRSAQAFYVAEAGARAVKRWFDRPGTGLRFPAPGVVDRTHRKILDETDPEDPAKATAADLRAHRAHRYLRAALRRGGRHVEPLRPGHGQGRGQASPAHAER
jgi:Tfp pilus assembly protein PilX